MMAIRKCLNFVYLSLPSQGKIHVAGAFLATLAQMIALLAQPVIVAKLVGSARGGLLSQEQMINTLSALSAAMILSALFSKVQAYYSNLALQDIRQGTKITLYESILHMHMDYFKSRNEGWIENSVATASQAARSIVYDGLIAISISRIIIFLALSSALLVFIEPSFGMIFIVAATVYIMFSYRMATTGAKLVSSAVASTAKVSACAADVVANIEQIQLSDKTIDEKNRLSLILKKEKEKYIAAQSKIDLNEFLQRIYLMLLFGFFVISTSFLAGKDPSLSVLFYITGLIAYGQLESTGKILNSMFEMMQKLSTVLDSLQFSHYSRLQPQHSSPRQLTPNAGGIGIIFEKVTFSYPGSPALFTQLSIDITSGEHVIIAGRSGSGKSTFLKLIAGILLPSRGIVSLDGISTSDISFSERAQALSAISQHATLFDRSLYENATYGVAGIVDREKVESILSLLDLEHLRERAGVGSEWLNAHVGRNGLGLSGGERQRVLMARVILQKKPLIVLDEATSALDTVSERRVLELLHELCPTSTIIAVSHHPHDAMSGYRTIQVNSIPSTRGDPKTGLCAQT